MAPLTPAERDALRLRAEQADEVFSGRTVGELRRAESACRCKRRAARRRVGRDPCAMHGGAVRALAGLARGRARRARAASRATRPVGSDGAAEKGRLVSATSTGRKPPGRFTRQAEESERLAMVRGLVASAEIREPPTSTGSTGTTSAPGERLPVDGDKQPRRAGLDVLHRRTRRVSLGHRPLAEPRHACRARALVPVCLSVEAAEYEAGVVSAEAE